MDKRVEQIEEFQENLSSVTYGLKELIALKLDIPNLKTMLKTLEKKETQLQKELSRIIKNCNHEWEYNGHDHKDDCYKCTMCGETEWR